MTKPKELLGAGLLLLTLLLAIQQPRQVDGEANPEGWMGEIFAQQTATATVAGGGSSSGGFALTVPDQQPVPPDQDATLWAAAGGTLDITTSGTEETSAVSFQAAGLIPYGLYSLWWVQPDAALMFDENARLLVFRTDADGNITAQFAIPANADYASHGVAAVYHASNVLVGDQWGNLGTDSFVHLTSIAQMTPTEES